MKSWKRVPAISPILCVACLFFAAALVSSCANRSIRLVDFDSLDPPAPAARIQAPHIAQNDSYSCGTTAVAMALSFLEGRTADPIPKDEAWAVSGSDPEFAMTKGHDIDGFLRLTGSFGYRAEFVDRLGLDRLKRLLSNGIPVVLIISPVPGKPYTHAVLAIGYVDGTETLLVEDPAGKKRAFGYGELDAYWKGVVGKPFARTCNAGFIIYPHSLFSR